MIREALRKVGSSEDLSYEEAASVMKEIMSGEALPTQVATFLTALQQEPRQCVKLLDRVGICFCLLRNIIRQ